MEAARLNALWFILFFFAGRTLSCLVYQICWANGRARRFHPWGATFTLLLRPRWWLLHVSWFAFAGRFGWQDFPGLHPWAVAACALLALGAVGRLGAVDLGSFFVADRVLVATLALAVIYSPAFIYPCLLAACCLQYTGSGWPLGPGYSNLLGFEFIRGSTSVLASCLILHGLLLAAGIGIADFESLAMAVVLGFQASYYVNHALAKSALGPKWFSWVRHNRLQCLLVNAHLRGWGAQVLSRRFLLDAAALVGRWRVPLCAAVWLMEFGWLLALADQRLTVALLAVTIAFHILVFLLTGLAAYQHIANHLVLLSMIGGSNFSGCFSPGYALASTSTIALTALWIAWLRPRVLNEYLQSGTASKWGKFSDAADLLMAWWDGPLMRMYSYEVELRDGRRFSFPVPKLSPYDTVLTDIHTHIMLLGLHQELDSQIDADRRIAPTGVWGLLADRDTRDRLYALMDDPDRDLSVLRPNPAGVPWIHGADALMPPPALALRDLFLGINRFQPKASFRFLMRWPHFPGEDLVPDICPIAARSTPRYRFQDPILSVTLFRIKTFYTGRDVILIENSVVGTLLLQKQHRGSP